MNWIQHVVWWRSFTTSAKNTNISTKMLTVSLVGKKFSCSIQLQVSGLSERWRNYPEIQISGAFWCEWQAWIFVQAKKHDNWAYLAEKRLGSENIFIFVERGYINCVVWNITELVFSIYRPFMLFKMFYSNSTSSSFPEQNRH